MSTSFNKTPAAQRHVDNLRRTAGGQNAKQNAVKQDTVKQNTVEQDADDDEGSINLGVWQREHRKSGAAQSKPAAPTRQAVSTRQAVPTKQAAVPTKQATVSTKQAVPTKQAAPTKQAVPTKQAAPTKPSVSNRPVSNKPAANINGSSTDESNVPAGTPVKKAVRQTDIPPIAVQADNRKLKVWEEANAAERAGILACINLKESAVRVSCEQYFKLAETIEKLYPVEKDAERRKRDEQIIKKLAEGSGLNKLTLYSILRVNKLYGRAGWSDLDAKAKTNGVLIAWTHLRTLADYLSEGKHRNLRLRIEKKMIEQQMTESMIKQMILEAAPEIIEKQTAKTVSKATIQTISGGVQALQAEITRKIALWLRVFEEVDSNYTGADVKVSSQIFEETSKIVENIAELKERLAEIEMKTLEMRSVADEFLKVTESAESSDNTDSIAQRIKDQMAQEDAETAKAQAQKEWSSNYEYAADEPILEAETEQEFSGLDDLPDDSDGDLNEMELLE